MDRPPDLLGRSPLVRDALAFARAAHGDPGGDGPTDVEHPLAVARILHDHGYRDEVVAAALLHDVVEDTPAGLDAIAERFGPAIALLVATLTEDPTIDSYPARKADHRRRLAAAGGEAAALLAADKLAKLRELAGERSTVEAPKLEHYRESVRMLRAAHPGVPFLDRLERELAAYERAIAAEPSPAE